MAKYQNKGKMKAWRRPTVREITALVRYRFWLWLSRMQAVERHTGGRGSSKELFDYWTSAYRKSQGYLRAWRWERMERQSGRTVRSHVNLWNTALFYKLFRNFYTIHLQGFKHEVFNQV